MNNDDSGCGVAVLILFFCIIFTGCNRINDLEKRLNRVESECRNLEWDLDKLKKEQQERR